MRPYCQVTTRPNPPGGVGLVITTEGKPAAALVSVVIPVVALLTTALQTPKLLVVVEHAGKSGVTAPAASCKENVTGIPETTFPY